MIGITYDPNFPEVLVLVNQPSTFPKQLSIYDRSLIDKYYLWIRGSWYWLVNKTIIDNCKFENHYVPSGWCPILRFRVGKSLPKTCEVWFFWRPLYDYMVHLDLIKSITYQWFFADFPKTHFSIKFSYGIERKKWPSGFVGKPEGLPVFQLDQGGTS